MMKKKKAPLLYVSLLSLSLVMLPTILTIDIHYEYYTILHAYIDIESLVLLILLVWLVLQALLLLVLMMMMMMLLTVMAWYDEC